MGGMGKEGAIRFDSRFDLKKERKEAGIRREY